MIAPKRVVVTGLGCISPLGLNTSSTWQGLLAGDSGIKPISHFDTSEYPVKIAAEIDNFLPESRIPPKDARKMDRFIQLGISAALEALEDSELDLDSSNLERAGVLIGAGIGGLGTIEKTTTQINNKGPRRVSPFYIPGSIINMVSGHLSVTLGFKGPNLAVVTACTTGTHSIGEAARIIALGDADVMLAGGTEAAITPTSLAGFSAAKALSDNNENPGLASRPWDLERNGFVMGEGAGVLLVEEYEHAKKRSAKIYAEIIGYGMSGDAFHMTQPSPGGEGAARCIRNALANAEISPDRVNYVNAHGTSTPLGDKAETVALKSAFGTSAYNLAVSSNKSMIGHLLGAAGGVEAVSTVLSIQENLIPPTVNLNTPDPECDLDYVPNTARDLTVKIAISNSFGFGGTNGTLVFSKI